MEGFSKTTRGDGVPFNRQLEGKAEDVTSMESCATQCGNRVGKTSMLEDPLAKSHARFRSIWCLKAGTSTTCQCSVGFALKNTPNMTYNIPVFSDPQNVRSCRRDPGHKLSRFQERPLKKLGQVMWVCHSLRVPLFGGSKSFKKTDPC